MGIHVIFRPEITLLVTENFLYVRCCNDPTCALERYRMIRQRGWVRRQEEQRQGWQQAVTP